MKYLIVSADDFGLTKSVNEGITRACRDGIVTNANLIPSGEAFDDAARAARDMGLTEVGAHLALTETTPLTDRVKIPTLIAKNGRFYSHYGRLFWNLSINRIDLDQAYIELRAQLARVAKTGLRVTSLSSHEHIHMMPAILDIFIKLALEYDIPFIRHPRREPIVTPATPKKIAKNLILTSFGKNITRVLKDTTLKTTEYFLGLVDSGKLNEGSLVKLISAVRDGTTELVTHPGFIGPEIVDRYRFHINCEAELFALTGKPVRMALAANGIKIVKFGDLV